MANDFLTTYTPLANDIATQTGLDPSVVLGIIDTETGGGAHVKGNNIFGISPSGPNGQYVASYPDVQTASQAFISLMQRPNYRAVTASSDPAAQAVALVRGGYNTANPNYAATVASKAKAIGSQLGYQGDGGDSGQPVALMATSAQPAATPAPAAPLVGSYSFPAGPGGAAPAPAPAPAPAATGSAKDQALSDPALAGGDTTAVPAQTPAAQPAAAPKSAKDQALSDPALQPTQTAATAATATEPSLASYAGAENTQHDQPVALPPTTIAGWRQAMAPEPGWVSSGVLPMATKEVSPGQGDPSAGVRWDWGPVRGAVNPLLDLLEGTGQATSMGGPDAPLAGKVSPEATLLLLGAKAGNPNPLQSRNALMAPAGRDIRFGPPEPVPPGLAAREAPLSPEFKANALTPEAKTAAVAEPSGPVSPTGVPVTAPQVPPGVAQPTGAQVTPAYEAIHTPAEEAAYRANAEGQKLIEGQKLGEADLNQYIPGETVNNAQREQTAKAARELKELGIRVPEASQMEKLAEESNDTARKVYTQNTSKGPTEITNRRTVRETDINADKAKVFAPDNVTAPVDFQPVVEQMEAVLRAPENRQNSALQSVYREQLERIKAAKIEDPAEAWGLRRDLDRLTDKRMAAKDPNLHYVAHHLDDVAGLIDTQIEKVAPGYSDMLAKYKEHSRAINEMEVLQGALDKLRGPGQKLTYNDFQRFMKNVVDSRMTPSHDLNAFKAISEENMQRLWNIRDSLRRTASAKELASAAGSDTMPNIIDALKAVGKMGGTAALHAYVGAHLGPGGNLALQSLGAVGRSLNDRRMIRRTMRQMNQLLRPSEPLRVPPGQENPLSGAHPP